MFNIYPAFQHKSEKSLQGSSYSGILNDYSGGGYAYIFSRNINQIQADLSALRNFTWIDHQTRAVFLEFSVYNPNVNLFMVSTILFETLPTGNLLHSKRFDSLAILNQIGLSSFQMIGFIIYLVFVVFYIFKEVKQLIKEKESYFLKFWTFLEWSLIILSWVSFAMYMYRLNYANSIEDMLKMLGSGAYIKMQSINNANQSFIFCLSFCCFLATLRLIKYFRFNKSVYIFVITLRTAFPDIAGYLFVWFMSWFAFVQIFYLIFNENVFKYSTLSRALTTTVKIMLGVFDSRSLFKVNNTLGPIFFFAFNVFIVMIMLSFLISIITEAFAKIKKRMKYHENEVNVLKYLHTNFKKKIISNLKKSSKKNTLYVESSSINQTIDQKMDNILNYFSNVYICIYLITISILANPRA